MTPSFPNVRVPLSQRLLRRIDATTPVPVRTSILCSALSAPRSHVWAALQRLERHGLVVRVTRRVPLESRPARGGNRNLETFWVRVSASARTGATMTLKIAQEMIRAGVPFGDVFPHVSSDDRGLLRSWFVRAPGVPVETPERRATIAASRRASVVTMPSVRVVPPAVPTSSPGTGTGDQCPRCGGLMVRTGTCETCQSCGETSGCA